MASPTAHAPHSGPVDQPGEGAYLYARSGIARSATTRSNYVAAQTAIDWIVRDDTGQIISTTDISHRILFQSLRVTQAMNDEPDTCSFTIAPHETPIGIPQVGHEIRVSWANGLPLFHGYIVTTQSDWRLNNLQPPWIAVQCQDAMWRFDARIVTYRFPTQSVSASIAFLVKYFCNLNPAAPHPLDFSTALVQPDMPSIPGFDVVNQRPSTVMRTLTAAVDGGFYIDGFAVHAWAHSVSEPDQSNPTPLTTGLRTLHSFRMTTDATQVRRRVIVEGRRTSTQTSFPAMTRASGQALGVPIADAESYAGGVTYLSRIGTQWMLVRDPNGVTMFGANPPQTRVQTAFVVGATTLALEKMPTGAPAEGWVRVGSQFAAYASVTGNPLTDTPWFLNLVPAASPYGVFTVPIAVGETVEWVDCFMTMEPHGLSWGSDLLVPTAGDDLVRSHPTDTPIVMMAISQYPLATWPPLEGFVQDGRYSFLGAQGRAITDLETFSEPLVSVEWRTDDVNAAPGRSQVIALSSATVDPPVNLTVTVLRVEIAFSLPTQLPRRSCSGGIVKPSTFMDLVVTENS